MSEDLVAAAISWWEEDPARLESEQAAMHAVAPDLFWRQEGSGRWVGHVPLWPIPRRQPSGVAALVRRRAFEVTIETGPAYPMIVPSVWPINVNPPVEALGWSDWHLLPNGSICLLQGNAAWDPATLAAELIPKISGWYIEYHLRRSKRINSMTEYGIIEDDSLDALLGNIPEEAESAKPDVGREGYRL